jgi:hypothetical protein
MIRTDIERVTVFVKSVCERTEAWTRSIPTHPSDSRPLRQQLTFGRPLMTLVRLFAGIFVLAMGGVHIQQYIVHDCRVIPTIGPLFLLNFIGGTVLGLYFLIPANRDAGRIRLLVDAVAAPAGWFLAAGALVGLLVSEHTPLFGFMEHDYRFETVFAIVSEAVAIVVLTILMVHNPVTARRTMVHTAARP